MPNNLKSKKITISVVLCTYNPGSELNDAIDSILRQTLLPNEVILIDDGSNEFSKKKITKLLKKNRNSKLKLFVNNTNIGLTKSLIKAVKLSSGKFIARIDSDDIWHRRHLEYSIKALMQSGASLVGGESEPFGKMNKKISNKKISYKILNDKFLFNPFVHSSVLFKKSEYNNVGRYSSNYKYSQDFELWIRFQISGVKIIKLKNSTVITRVLKSGVSQRFRYDQMRSAIKAIIKNYGFSIYIIICLIIRIVIFLISTTKRSLF